MAQTLDEQQLGGGVAHTEKRTNQSASSSCNNLVYSGNFDLLL